MSDEEEIMTQDIKTGKKIKWNTPQYPNAEYEKDRDSYYAPRDGYYKMLNGETEFCTKGTHLDSKVKLLMGFEGEQAKDSPVHHPPHYNAHPSGVECIEITRHMNFNLGNAIKYIWRAGLKTGPESPEGPSVKVQDLEKAKWYIEDEIKRLKKDKP